VKSRLRWALIGLASVTLAGATWAAIAPIDFESREELFAIPNGTWARRMAGEKLEILPSQVVLVAESHDVLVLRNDDDVPQIFGPTLIMPGQTFRLPFDAPAEYEFECSAHASGQMKVIVNEALTSPMARLRWRAALVAKKVSSWTN